jgi:hypothetical protein
MVIGRKLITGHLALQEPGHCLDRHQQRAEHDQQQRQCEPDDEDEIHG